MAARLKSEEALRESEDRTRLIVSHALDAVVTIDSQGRITSWNPQAESLFGWREDEVVGFLLTEKVIPPAHREAHGRGLARLAAGGGGRLLGRRIELTALRRDGTEFPIELAITPMPIGGKIVFSVFLRDITDRKQSEERAAELARLARALTESLDMGTVTDRVVTSVVAVFKARAAFISLVEPDGFLRCVALAGNPLERVPAGLPFASGCRDGRPSRRRAPTGVDLRRVERARPRIPGRVPPRRRVSQQPLGSRRPSPDQGGRHRRPRIHRRQGPDLLHDEVGRLQTFADQAALAIRNVQLFSTEQAARAKAATLAERLEVLHEIDQALISGEAPEAIAAKAVVRLRDLLGVPRAIVNLFDLAAGEAEWLAAAGRRRVHRGPGVRFPLSLMGDVEALRRGELQVVDVASLPPSSSTEALLASGVSTYMVVPMIANGELLGGLSFGGEPGEYSAEQVSIAREVAAQLAIAVQQARLHERVKRHAEELTQRVRERTLELTDANEQLKRESADRERAEALADRANRAKSEFLSRMSHELRTPLNGIIGFGQLLQLDALEPEQRESVEHILKGGRHLLALINEVLDITRIEADTLSVSLEPVSSDEALRTALSLVRPQAAARMVTLREVVPCDCYVMADRQRLHQVLLNLLSNAIKYNREGGSVEVSCTKTAEGRVQLAVSDTGHGISPAMLARLFTPFDRLGAEELGIEGTGLGLALSKRLVEAMNGSLVVESRRGVGTRFTAELAGAEAPWAVSVGPEDMAADTGTPRARATVLYIEDNLANLRLVERIIGPPAGADADLGDAWAARASSSRGVISLRRSSWIFICPTCSGGEVLARLREDSRTTRDPRRDPQRRCDARADRTASRSGRSRLPDQAARRRSISSRASTTSLRDGKAMPNEVTTAKILIVDDEPTNVRLLERLLQATGYRNLESTTDSRRVLELYQAFGPDLILLDLLMPHLDGIGVLGQLKAVIPADEYLPVLILTADVTIEAKHRALAAGAKDFVTKPFDQVETLLRIENLLHTRQLYLALEAQKRSLEETVRDRTARLVQSEKVAAMGSLLTGVAHELNNPLTVIVGSAQLLRLFANDPDAVARRVDSIEAAAERCVRIVRNFLSLARQRPPERADVRLNDVVQGAVELLAYELRMDNIEVCRRSAGQSADTLGRPASAPPGPHEPHHECPSGDAPQPATALDLLHGAPRRFPRSRPSGGDGYRTGHRAGAPGQGLRTVLHDQADRRGDRTRPRALPQHDRGARRDDRARQRARERQPVHDRAPGPGPVGGGGRRGDTPGPSTVESEGHTRRR